MKRMLSTSVILLALALTGGVTPQGGRGGAELPAPSAEVDSCLLLYSHLTLAEKVSLEAFRQAYNGYRQIENRQKNLLTLIDFSKPSSEERLFVIDMEGQKLLYQSLVAHGRNSGDLYATTFSNRPNSHQSSLGFYLTGETYGGSNGYSPRLDGLE